MNGERLRIAVFSDSALPVLNGVSMSIDALVQELRERGHSVHLFTSAYFKHRDRDPNTVRFFALQTPFAKDYPLALPPFYPFIHEFRRHRFDIVHTHTPFTVGFVGLRWAESEGIPIVSTYHTHYDRYVHYLKWLPKRYLRYRVAKHTNWYYNRVRHVITPSEASSRWLQRHSVYTPTTVIPTGIPAARPIDRDEARHRLGIAPHHKVLLYTGRIALEKNVVQLLKAAAIMFREDPDLRFWLVGGGPAIGECQRVARELQIGDRVTFAGFQPRHDVNQYYAVADLFWFASVTETQGLVVVEAMSYGLPVVVASGGGASMAVENGVNGYIIRNDPELFAEKASEILSNPLKMRDMGEAARQAADEYTIPRMADRVLAVYQEVLHGDHATRELEFAGER